MEKTILCLTLVLLVVVITLTGITVIGIIPLMIFDGPISNAIERITKRVVGEA